MEIDVEAGDVVPKAEVHRNARARVLTTALWIALHSNAAMNPSSSVW
jgi:hypothetical protein